MRQEEPTQSQFLKTTIISSISRVVIGCSIGYIRIIIGCTVVVIRVIKIIAGDGNRKAHPYGPTLLEQVTYLVRYISSSTSLIIISVSTGKFAFCCKLCGGLNFIQKTLITLMTLITIITILITFTSSNNSNKHNK